jgi:hypothetical protein
MCVFFGGNFIIHKATDGYFVCAKYISKNILSSRILYEEINDNFASSIYNEYLAIEKCTEVKEKFLGLEFTEKTDIKKVFNQHKKIPDGGWRPEEEFIELMSFINEYMFETFRLENYIKMKKIFVTYNKINSKTYILSEISASGKMKIHTIFEIHDHEKLRLYFAVIKMIIDALEKSE